MCSVRAEALPLAVNAASGTCVEAWPRPVTRIARGLARKFHCAASERTAAQIIIQRADGALPGMRMTCRGNREPTLPDAKIAKNYMDETELRSMEILAEQWLLYAEGMAARRSSVSMARLLNKLSELIKLNEYATFPGYAGIKGTRAQADEHARRQLEIYRKAILAP